MKKNNTLVHTVHYQLLSFDKVIVFPCELLDKLVLLHVELVVDNVNGQGAEQNVWVNFNPYSGDPIRLSFYI